MTTKAITWIVDTPESASVGDDPLKRLQAAEWQVETLRAQLDAMREALRPFAVWADRLPSDGPDSREIAAYDSHLTYGDVRRARAALKGPIE